MTLPELWEQLPLQEPLDLRTYPRDPRARILTSQCSSGRYVYAVDEAGTIWLLPDSAAHLHPKILGSAKPARYAGEVVVAAGEVLELTNCSGTFQFQDEAGLIVVAHLMMNCGLSICPSAVVLHYFDKVSRPKVLDIPPLP